MKTIIDILKSFIETFGKIAFWFGIAVVFAFVLGSIVYRFSKNRDLFILKISNKNVYRVRTTEKYRRALKGLLAFFMVLLAVLGVGRIGWITLVKGEKYRAIAENDSYTETKLTAVRGTIYDSDMNVLSMSYGIYELVADPYSLNEKVSGDINVTSYYRLMEGSATKRLYKNDAKKDEIKTTVTEKYYRAVSDALEYIVNEGVKKSSKKYFSADYIYEKLTQVTKTVVVGGSSDDSDDDGKTLEELEETETATVEEQSGVNAESESVEATSTVPAEDISSEEDTTAAEAEDVSSGLSDESEDDMPKETRIVNNHYASVFSRDGYIKKLTATQKRKIEYLLSGCFYNYYQNMFLDISHKEENDEEPKAYYYDYKNDSYVGRDQYDAEHGGTNEKFLGLIKKCSLSEGSAYLFNETSKRSYPDDGYCSAFLGMVSDDGGKYGLEAYYDSVLSGKDGQVSGLAVNYSGRMKDTSGAVENTVQNGGNLVLTIKPQIQKILEDNLKNAYTRYSADETFGVVMNCKTGAVYGISNYPNYDLNNSRKITDEANALEKARTQIVLENTAAGKLDEEGNVLEPEQEEIEERARNNQWSCFCVNYPYELGSTFKMFTASAAIEEGVIDPESTATYYNCHGSYLVQEGEPKIACSHGTSHGSLDLGEALAKSCNGFFIHLGLNMGANAFNKYFKSFGLNEKTGIDISGEVVGYNAANSKMTRFQLASSAFGQTATITAIQLITGAAAVANGGKLVTPHLVDKIIDSDGNVISKTETEVKRRVISEQTSKIMTEKLKKVIYDSYGTAHNYFTLDGYTAAGKTGSGEIQGLGASKHKNDFKYTASFVGYAPAEDPEVIVLFGIRNPKGGYRSGGEIAAPPASTVLQCALKELNIPKSKAIDDGTVPDIEEMPILTAQTLVSNAGFSYNILGSGKTVLHQIPEAGDEMPETGLIVAFTDDESYEETAVVPDFEGKTKAEAFSLARDAGLNVICKNWENNNNVATHQSHKAGENVYPGKAITVSFG